MNKIFVLDTNILLLDPQAIYKFDEHTIAIPIYVIEEIDKFKRDLNEVGRNARQVSRYLDEMRKEGKLSKGVKTPGGGMIRVELEARNLSRIPEILKKDTPDNKILTIALYLKEKHEDSQVIFISKDINLRIKADAIGIITEDYEATKVEEIEELYTGIIVKKFDSSVINEIHEKNTVLYDETDLHPNQFVLMQDVANNSHTAIARFVKHDKHLVKIKNKKEGVWGLQARNVEQTFALEALTNKDIQLVTLVGKAGTGKTLLAIAAGLFTTELGIYQKLLVSRPIFPLGRDIGFLPGNVEDKLKPWMQPIFDNMELLMSIYSNNQGKKGKTSKAYSEYVDQGIVEIEPLTYIRGRSIPNQFMVIDEAQNLTPHELKTIITRAGVNSKIVITGDPYQIDNPYVDSASNGLSYVVEKMKGEEISAHVTMLKGERSYLAETAANIL